MTTLDERQSRGALLEEERPARAGQGPPSRARSPRVRIPRPNGMVLLALIPSTIIVGLVVVVLFVSLRVTVTDGGLTLDHFRNLFSDSFALTAARNTIGFATMTLLVALAFGIPMAWLVERTDLPAKRLVYVLMTIGILIPGFFAAMGWLLLLHPRIGWITGVVSDHLGIHLNVVSLTGMGFVQGLGLAPIIFIMTVAGLRSMDAGLEEAAVMSGAGRLAVIRRVTLPLVWPGILGASIFVFMIAVAAFDVPLIIGVSNRIYVFSTYLFTRSNPTGGLPDYGLLASFSVMMILLGLTLTVLYVRTLARARRYQVISGKGYRPRVTHLGRWKIAGWLFIGSWIGMALVLPLVILAWSATQPFFQPPSIERLEFASLDNFRNLDTDLVRRTIGNTLRLMLFVPTLAIVVSIVFSWVVLRTRGRFRFVFDYVALLPLAVAGAIFAFAALIATLNYVDEVQVLGITVIPDLYRTMPALIIVMAMAQVSFASRVTNAAMLQIHPELEESARMSGASTFQVLRRVTVPLIWPAIMYAWLWLALLAFREFTISTMMKSEKNLAMAPFVNELLNSHGFGQASALVLICVVLLSPVVIIYWRFGRRGELFGA